MENHFEKDIMIRDSAARINRKVEATAVYLKKAPAEIYEAINFDPHDFENDLLAKPDIFTHKTFTQDVAHLKYCEDVMAEKLSEYVDSLNGPIDSRNPSRFTFLKNVAAYTTPLKKLGMLAFSLAVTAAITGISGCVGQTPTTAGGLSGSTNEAATPHQKIFQECATNFKASTYQSMTDAQLNQFASYIESGSYTDPVTLLQKSVKSATSVSKLDSAMTYMKQAAALIKNGQAIDVYQQLIDTNNACFVQLANDYIGLPDGSQVQAYGEPSDLCTKLAQSPTQGLLMKGKSTFECYAEKLEGKGLGKLSNRYLDVINAELLEFNQVDSPVGNLLKGVLSTPTATTAVATTATTPAATTAVATTAVTSCDPSKVIELKVGSRIDCLPGAEFVGKDFMTMYTQIKDGYSYPGGKFLLKNAKVYKPGQTDQVYTTDVELDIPKSTFTLESRSYLELPTEAANSMGLKRGQYKAGGKNYSMKYIQGYRQENPYYYNGDDIKWESRGTDVINVFRTAHYETGALAKLIGVFDYNGDGFIDYIGP